MTRHALICLTTLGVFSILAPSVRATTVPPAEPHAGGESRTAGWIVSDCPVGTVPDFDTCVHPSREDEGMDELTVVPSGHFDKQGRFTTYEQIPRRPERPAAYDAYRYPVAPGLPGGHFVVSGYDLDKPDSEQRRGRTLRAVGHGGVDLPQDRGARVELVPLEHQIGDADVVFAGWLFGNTVITRHTVREGGGERDYLVLFGHLEAPAPGIAAGTKLHDGERVGSVGDSGSPELVHLHFEVRRVQEGVDVFQKTGGALLDATVSTVCDPRNVLPLR